MFLSEDFIFNGKRASSFGLKLVRLDSNSFIEEPIIGGANLIEVETNFDFKPHLYNVKRTPLEFSLQLALTYDEQAVEWTPENKKLIYAWLFHSKYKPLIFDDDPTLIYYAIITEAPALNTIHDKGYLDIHFRTNSPYPWTKEQKIMLVGNTSLQTSHTVNITNILPFTKNYFTTRMIRLPGGTDESTIGILNNTVGSVSDYIRLNSSLITGYAEFTMDGKTKTIYNGLTSLYKYKSPILGDSFPYLIQGTNNLLVSRGWSAEITYQFPVIR